MAVGDLNGDAKLDLAVANLSSNDVSVLLANGDGTFQTPANYGVHTAPVAVAVGDLNGDGKLDLAVADAGSNDVSVLLGNGDGSFQTATNYDAHTTPYSALVGDLNGDAKPDLGEAASRNNRAAPSEAVASCEAVRRRAEAACAEVPRPRQEAVGPFRHLAVVS